MKRLLLILALTLMSSACATAKPEYRAVSEGVLIPPMSTFSPANTESATPRPPAPAEVVIDDVEVIWPPGMEPEATPRPPVAAPTPTTEVLKSQINNLLAQIDSLQKNTDNRRPSKLERYARELAAKDAELKEANLKIANLEDEVRYQRGTLNLMGSQIKTMQDLKDKALDDVVLLREKGAIDERKLARAQTHLQVSLFLLLVLTVFAVLFGFQRGRTKATRDFQARIGALESAIDARKIYITELKEKHKGELRLRNTLLMSLQGDNVELREKLKDERRMYRNRIQEIKRQHAGPLPETVDDDPPPETLPDDDNLPEAVFGPLEREEREE